jgi:uncharacterized protein YjiS (DUF1127 family)
MQNNNTKLGMEKVISLTVLSEFILEKLKKIFSNFKLWQGRRRTRYYLSEMSPYMLKDVGITESERQEELGKKFWQ